VERKHLERVVVVGSSSSGKTTLARSLSLALGVSHIELDALHWGPEWTKAPVDEFRQRVEVAVTDEAWVCDGNYSTVRDLVWQRATTLIWLNYSFPLTFSRAVRRTLVRAITREELYGGNRESLTAVFDPEWIPWWVIRTFRKRRREYPELFRRPDLAHLEVLEFRRPAQTRSFLARTESTGPEGTPADER
jgi:adenylate kinase family enzyme